MRHNPIPVTTTLFICCPGYYTVAFNTFDDLGNGRTIGPVRPERLYRILFHSKIRLSRKRIETSSSRRFRLDLFGENS